MKKWVFALVFFNTLTLHATGNADAGQEKSTVCAACHGAQGISVNPDWPNLAGQHATYLVKQMIAYKQGEKRNNPTMMAMVNNLTSQDMDDLAAFYAKQPPEDIDASKANQSRGKALYYGGDFNKHITACIACHGPQGTGNEQAGFPVLSGQHAAYTRLQLQAFKDGKRSNDLNSIMRDISARMDTNDMKAVADYIAGLHR